MIDSGESYCAVDGYDSSAALEQCWQMGVMNIVDSVGNASFAGAMADERTIIPVASIHRMMFEH
ncbi:hypothetical protein VL04_13270 [Chromobacterium violaceum]|uniref:Uncharacterized protein n=1 Tax=Chromobacterium violaceum TaxID=536 RepID=A0A3S4HIL9_CHRVL|nr:hypothetical protein VK93_05775 [Chromobacterium violaceum]KMN85235.1 hypothetical protein VL02_15290 [Chromobacterium violaceum]KMN89504.1 hypothetical protein VL04_13270 [Chromobacterium violaceum]KMO03546.1 hypothetical protein VL16_11025 [Chromobacterium violaceum]VEB40354.1 Uncharacterised protein [Chromobacterium violaceum]